MKNAWVFGLALVVLVGGFPLADSPGQDKKVRELMARKLDHSQKVLEGIALNDFDKITRNADELISISKTTEWKVLKTPEFELYSNDFRRSAAAMIDHSKNKNLDGAALAYVEMTLTCVKCHKHVREVRMARQEPGAPMPAVASAGR